MSTVIDTYVAHAFRSPARWQLSGFRRKHSGEPIVPFDAELDRLFNERFPALYRYLYRLSDDAALAEDVAQDAFLRLFDRGQMPQDPVAWLITVATNRLRDDRRQAGRRLRLLERADDVTGHGTGPIAPDLAVVRSELQRQVRQALQKLTPRDRQALLLRHSGFSYREIAVALAMPVASVGTTLLRAGAAFRASYEELHGEPD